MKSEDEPISADEWLLRRVRKEKFRTDKNPLISPNAFEPRIKGDHPDTDGISLFREACQQIPTDILSAIASDKRGENGIVKIPVTLIQQLGMSVKMIRDEQISGHVVIPELNAVDYANAKMKFVLIKEALANEASKDMNIILYPTAS